MRNNISILYISTLPWGKKTQREQHLLRSLSKLIDVYYLETFSFKNLKDWLLNFPIRFKKINKTNKEKIILISVSFFIPNKYDFLRINDRYLYLLLKVFCRWLWNHNKIILGIGFPKLPLFYKKFPAFIRYYDCMDNRPALAEVCGDNPKRVKLIEEKIEKEADIIFLSAETLKTLSKHRKKAVVINNAVDLSCFYGRPKEMPNDMPKNGKPIIGYIGAIDSWFDFETLEMSVKNKPNYNFVLIGDVKKKYINKLKSIEKIGNLFLLGPKQFTQLHEYIYFFNVGLILFKVNEITKYVDPLKMYEYLAMGKPIISSNLPEVKKMAPFIKIYKGPEEFLAILDETAKKPHHDPDSLKKIAEKNTWDKRAVRIFSELMRKIKEAENL